MTANPGHSTEGTRDYDALRAGEYGFVTEEVTVENGENVVRGQVMAIDGTSGDWAPYDSADTDRDIAKGVMAEDVDASGGAKKGVVYRNGVFAIEKITIAGGSLSDFREAAADKGLYFKNIIQK